MNKVVQLLERVFIARTLLFNPLLELFGRKIVGLDEHIHIGAMLWVLLVRYEL